ncbi:6322_t:CDS:2, partial [Gigaspora rosea]
SPKNQQEGFPFLSEGYQINNITYPNYQYSPESHQGQYQNLQVISLDSEHQFDNNKRMSDFNKNEFDSTIAPCEFDSSLFDHPSTSPIFEPAVDFSTVSSIRQLDFLNIPWSSHVTNIASDGTMSSVNSLTSSLSSKRSPTKSANSRSRENKIEPISKNDAARESRRKITNLKKQVYKLQTRIAVLEKELEEESIDKYDRDFPGKRKLIACDICRVQKKRCVGGEIRTKSYYVMFVDN